MGSTCGSISIFGKKNYRIEAVPQGRIQDIISARIAPFLRQYRGKGQITVIDKGLKMQYSIDFAKILYIEESDKDSSKLKIYDIATDSIFDSKIEVDRGTGYYCMISNDEIVVQNIANSLFNYIKILAMRDVELILFNLKTKTKKILFRGVYSLGDKIILQYIKNYHKN